MKFILFILSLTLTSCASLPDAFKISPSCTFYEGVLKLNGEIDDEFLNCVERFAGEKVTEIQINSTGGDVESAIKTSYILHDFNAHMIVEEKCNSSCANYFLPVARKLTLLPDAVILLHGGADPALGAKGAPSSAIELQKKFISRFRVHPGWLFYRETPEDFKTGVGRYVSGEPGWDHLDTKIRYIFAEPKLIRSCLKSVELELPDELLTARLSRDAAFVRRLEKSFTRPSGSLRCTEEVY